MVTKQFHKTEANTDWVESGWARPINGASYEWIDGDPATAAGAQRQADRRWLFLANYSSKDQLALYRPLSESPALFRNFAKLEPTEERFRAFANQFGTLGDFHPGRIGNRLFTGVPLSRYLSEREALDQVVGMLDALERRSNLRTYAERISHSLIDRGMRPGRAAELRSACVDWVQARINEHLGVSPDAGDSVSMRLGRDASGRLRLEQRTRSLVGILWLQCARAAEGNQVFRQCASQDCRDWFLISPEGGGKRRQAIYCSDRCKVRAFRARRDRGPSPLAKRRSK